MIERRTALIIGAGASSECGLPTGSELKDRIAELLNIRFEDGYHRTSGDDIVYDALRSAARQAEPPVSDMNLFWNACRRITDAMPQARSIDSFIDAHQGDKILELCGKVAIVRSILEAEKKSLLYTDPRTGQQKPHFETLQNTWLNLFFQLLTESCKFEDLKKRFDGLTLIVFNYDRCIEHFLFYALQNYYSVSSEEASALLGQLAIFHPYGFVAPLYWQQRDGHVDFAAEPRGENLLALVQQIRTFSEGTDPAKSEIQQLRTRLLGSQIVLFLGFAYHRLNLQLLYPEGGPHHDNPTETKYFGTAFRISYSDCSEIQTELTKLGGAPVDHIHIRNDLTSAKLFTEYWRTLSL